MHWTVFGLTLLLLLSLPSSAFANFNGIVYTLPDNLSDNQLDIDSQVLSYLTDTVKLYDNQYMEQTVLEFSQKGINVYVGINVLEDQYQDRLDRYVEIAKNYPNVLAIILESDPIDKFSESQIIEIVRDVKEQGVKVSVASAPDNWNKMKSVLNEVDFPYYYMFDYWNGLSTSQALTKLHEFHQKNIQTYDVQPVYEIGYPDAGDVIGDAYPSSMEQKKFIEGLHGLDGNYVLFSYSNEKQKFKPESPGNAAEQNFGLMKNGKIKHNFSEIINKTPLEVNMQILDDMTLEYVPTLIQDKSKPESMHEVMEIDIVSEQGNIDIHYDDKQESFEVVKSLTILLELDSYENVKIIGDSIDSVSFFSIPTALAQCDLDIISMCICEWNT